MPIRLRCLLYKLVIRQLFCILIISRIKGYITGTGSACLDKNIVWYSPTSYATILCPLYKLAIEEPFNIYRINYIYHYTGSPCLTTTNNTNDANTANDTTITNATIINNNYIGSKM